MKNIEEHYHNKNNEAAFLEYMDDRHHRFWEGLSFIQVLNAEKYNEDSFFYEARFLITGRLINHIAATYEMLKMGLEDESLVMYRQSLELAWLLKYFIENPQKTEKWVKNNKSGRISPEDRRKAVDNNSTSQKLYKQLSEVVHSNRKSYWGIGVGGMFNPYIIDKISSHIFILIGDVIKYFKQIMDMFNFDILEYEELANLYEEVTQNVWIGIYISGYRADPVEITQKLIQIGDIDVLRYLEARYKLI